MSAEPYRVRVARCESVLERAANKRRQVVKAGQEAIARTKAKEAKKIAAARESEAAARARLKQAKQDLVAKEREIVRLAKKKN